MAQFHETMLGKRFFDGQLPTLIKMLERIAVALEEQNKLATESKSTTENK